MREFWRLTAAPDHDQSVLAQELQGKNGSINAIRLSVLMEVKR
jgi:hypothetical protein